MPIRNGVLIGAAQCSSQCRRKYQELHLTYLWPNTKSAAVSQLRGNLRRRHIFIRTVFCLLREPVVNQREFVKFQERAQVYNAVFLCLAVFIQVVSHPT